MLLALAGGVGELMALQAWRLRDRLSAPRTGTRQRT
jgi:hypothetical protein